MVEYQPSAGIDGVSAVHAAAPVVIEVSDAGLGAEVAAIVEGIEGARVAMPGASIEARGGDRRVLVRSPDEISDPLRLFFEGAWAVVPAADLRSQPDTLRDAVAAVARGVSPLLMDIACEPHAVDTLMKRLAAGGGRATAPVTTSPLTVKETEILSRIARGQTSRHIADDLGFQLQTVKNRVTSIMNKTGTRSRSHAAALAQANGWISGPLEETA